MGKSYNAFQYLSTTGTGIAIGTNILYVGFIRGSELAGTLTLKVGTAMFSLNSATGCVSLASPIAIPGPFTMTSSGGDHFVIMFRKCP